MAVVRHSTTTMILPRVLRRSSMSPWHHHLDNPSSRAITTLRSSEAVLHSLRRPALPSYYPRRTIHATPTLAAGGSWWNPFRRNDAARDSGGVLGSARTQRSDDVDHPRRIQERKDIILALLALEFRSISLQKPSLSRQEWIDQAFARLDEQDLDEKTTLQLRHALQTALEPQVIQVFEAFGKVDEELDLEELEDHLLIDNKESPMISVMEKSLQLELERTIDALADTGPSAAEKGASPHGYLEIKRGALETLLKKQQEQEQQQQQKSLSETAITEEEDQATAPPKQVTWADADDFGYHETIDAERNRQVRNYQAINLCRAAHLRDALGYSVVALRSSIPGAGRGVFVDGFARAGSILAFQPGEVWSKEHMLNVSVDVERQLEKNDHFQMSLRSDDFMIDSRKSPYSVLTGPNSNSMALGHIINHPTAVNSPNCRTIMVNFTKAMDFGSSLRKYIPNTYARPYNATLTGSLLDREAVEMHGMCVIASRDICNEEIFYDYRLMTSQFPSWYHRVEDTAYSEEDPEESSETTKA